MYLTRKDGKVQATKSLLRRFNMPIFAVDLLKDSYQTEDPFIICKLANEILDVKLEVAEVLEMLYKENKPITQLYSTNMASIFK